MHLNCSSLTVILCTVLFSQYINCSPKREDQWWNNLTGLTGQTPETAQETRRRSQWTTLDGKKTTPKLSTQTTNRSIKRSSFGFDDDFDDSPFRTSSRNWEKSYARRRDFDSTWKDSKPIRERFSQTEWDDDKPVRHVFRDSISSIDEGPTRSRFGDEFQRDRMSRPWSRGDSWTDSTFSGGRSNNKNVKNSNKPKATTTTSQQSKADRTDRILNLNFQDEDSKRKDKERLNKLAQQIFGSMEDDTEDANVDEIPKSNSNSGNKGNSFNGNNGNNGRPNGNSGYGSGYVRNAMNTFTRTPVNTVVSTTGGSGSSKTLSNDLNRNTEKQTSNRLTATKEVVKPVKPKFNAIETTAAKPERTSNTAKPNNANDIRGVAEKPKTSTTPSAPLKFGWRSSISHSNDQKKQKLQNNNENNDNNGNGSNGEEEEDEFVDELGDDFDDTTTTRAPARAINRTTTKTVVRTTIRPTTMKAGVEYTTYRYADTTRPQTTTFVTNKPNREPPLTTITTSRPKAITPQTSKPSATDDSLAPNKKQHRMGSWVDSESLDYVNNEGNNENNLPNEDLPENIPEVIPVVPQPLIGGEEFEDEQLPERVEMAPIPPPTSDALKFARQSAREQEDGEGGGGGGGWTLEDALPGVPGTDYATFATVPRTAFDCKTHEWPGYYADVETMCQVFHICQTGGRKNSFLCPNGTMFNQQLFVCDWWHNVQCGDSPTHYPLNENIYDRNWESKRINQDEPAIKRSGALESAEPLTATTTELPEITDSENEDTSDSLEKRMDSDSNPIDGPNDDFIDETVEEPTGKQPLTQRVRSPIRIYRTSRIITDPDRQKRRRRKRGYLKN